MGSVGTREGQVGYFGQCANYYWHFAKCCRTTGASYRMIWKYWQGARVAGKVPNVEKVPGRSIARQRDARRTSPCVLHTFRSVFLPNGQWPAPSGSWRVFYFLLFFILSLSIL